MALNSNFKLLLFTFQYEEETRIHGLIFFIFLINLRCFFIVKVRINSFLTSFKFAFYEIASLSLSKWLRWHILSMHYSPQNSKISLIISFITLYSSLTHYYINDLLILFLSKISINLHTNLITFILYEPRRSHNI